MGSTIGPSSSGLSPQYQRLIQKTLQIESQPKIDLENRRQQEKDTKSLVSDLDSKLSSLQSQLSTLTDEITNPFEGRSASAEEGTEAFSVSADKSAGTGTHSVAVNRLASEDGRVSQTYSAGGSELSTFFTDNGQQTFEIGVATPTDSNPEARTQISVSVNSDGSDNEAVLKDIRTAIDDALQTAVDNGTISSDERPNVSVVNPTSDTARLSVRSSQTGYRGRLSFSDSADGLLSSGTKTLGVSADQLAKSGGVGSQGGELTEVGTDEASSKLTSEFTLDGLALTRNSNEVDNALDGITINLDEATGTESSFEVTADKEGAKSAVKEFISRFNEVNSFLQEKTRVDPENDERGALADDSTFRRLQFQLRTDATQPVDGQPEGLSSLRDIGIEASRDGTLELKDEEALFTALEENQEGVKQLFAGPDGVATRLETRVDQFVDAGGILDTREDIVENTIDRLDGRIEQFNERLDRREQQLRERFARVQSTIRSLASQQQALSARLP
jgi:flagellar hook-associated protein 2